MEAKDLYAATKQDSKNGYSIRKQTGDISTKKFINTLDYSLDAIKLREVYEKVTRRKNFSFEINGKEYTQQVINVKFSYSYKEFNKAASDIYIRAGNNFRDCLFQDGVALSPDGQLIGIQTGVEITDPLPKETLGKCFDYNEETKSYIQIGTIPVVKNKAELREELYKNGFVCDGIKYVRYKRSSGSSRVGKCLFVNEALYGRMTKWDRCGLTIKDGQEIDLAAYEAYISLPMSSIIDTIDILPENILIIDDYESSFDDEVVAVEEKDGRLAAEEKTVKVTNSIWDGQSLMDTSLFSKYPDKGMLLLRNRFFKSCAFNCNIQKWFEDNGITNTSQLNGFTLAKNVSDIKLITTPSSIKYLKFGTAEQWLKSIDVTFGVVKHEKNPHFFDGRMVQTHYQLLNTLHMSYEDIEKFLKQSFDYIDYIRRDPDILRHHISYPYEEMEITPLNSKNEIVFKLLGINNKFANTKLYNDFKNDLVRSLVNDLRDGRVLVNGNYSTLFGNGMEMLKAAVGQFDGTSELVGNQIRSTRFPYWTDILGSRSPHVTMGDIALFKNVRNENYDKYFNLSKAIVCVNSIGENILQRLQGADFDSDTVLLTDSKQLINAAKKHYNDFKVPTNMVAAIKRRRYYTVEQQADLDVKTSVNKIGEIINESQRLNSILWERLNKGANIEDIKELYCDVCKLSALSNIEIDRAKKEFVIDTGKEIRYLKEKYKVSSDEKYIKPIFFKRITLNNGYKLPANTKYRSYMTTMDYVQKVVTKFARNYNRREKRKFEPLMSIIKPPNINIDYLRQGYYYGQKNRIIDIVRSSYQNIKALYAGYSGMSQIERDNLFRNVATKRQECVEYIEKITCSDGAMYLLLEAISKDENKDISRFMFNMLFGTPNKQFFKMIIESKETLCELVEWENGNIPLYDYLYYKQKIS